MERPTVDQLREHLEEPLGKVFGSRSQVGEVSLLCPIVPVADDVTKLLVRDSTGRPRAVALCSAPVSPELVARGMERARQARDRLGPELGRVILDPLAEGRVMGLTFALLPYCKPLSDSSPVWRIQRRLLRRVFFDWLSRATQQTVAEVQPHRVERDFLRPLKHLAELDAMSDHVRAATGRAIERLRNGVWRPRYVLMHGDLCKGNILIDVSNATGSRRRRWPHRFVIIDWPGARLEGYAMCDLIRLAPSMKLTGRRLLDEVRRHCRLLRCEALDAWSYLLAGLGHLGMNLEYFPRERYVRAVAASFQSLQGVEL